MKFADLKPGQHIYNARVATFTVEGIGRYPMAEPVRAASIRFSDGGSGMLREDDFDAKPDGSFVLLTGAPGSALPVEWCRAFAASFLKVDITPAQAAFFGECIYAMTIGATQSELSKVVQTIDDATKEAVRLSAERAEALRTAARAFRNFETIHNADGIANRAERCRQLAVMCDQWAGKPVYTKQPEPARDVGGEG